MARGPRALFNGIAGLGLAILMWRLTHNPYAWAALYYPASVCVAWGLFRVFVLDD
jgi:hypothetical protein